MLTLTEFETGASYRNELERTMVLVRLGTLALIYREFCDLAFDEGSWAAPVF
jgi:hypothetical protein